MPKDVLRYKGYTSSLEVSLEDNCLYGRIEDIDDLVTYEAQTVEGARSAFQEAVEHYLQVCAELGEPVNQPSERAATAQEGNERGLIGR